MSKLHKILYTRKLWAVAMSLLVRSSVDENAITRMLHTSGFVDDVMFSHNLMAKAYAQTDLPEDNTDLKRPTVKSDIYDLLVA